MIHRIDLINDPPVNGARQQLIWTALGVILFILVVVVVCAITGRCSGSPTPSAWPASCCCCCRWCPGSGTEKFGARIWIQVGPYSFQPAEAAKVLLAIAFAVYLVEKRDVLALAGYRILGIDLPRARDLGPILVMWLISLAILVLQRDLGTSLLFFGLFVMMLYVSTERAGLGGARHLAVRRPAPTSATSTSATSGSGWAPGWTRSPTTTPTTR